MLLADLLFLVIVVYLAYRFIFNFLIPIVRTTHHVRKQFQHMREAGTNDNFQGKQPESAGNGANRRTHKPPAEDYIDFEEVK